MPQAVHPASTVSVMTPDQAVTLNVQIDAQIAASSQHRLNDYLLLAPLLHQMHDGEGYRALQFRSWRDYCETKHEFSLYYLSQLLKLGQAGITNVEGFPGLTASMLLTYAKSTDFPEQILPLMQATWAEIQSLSVRDAEKHLQAFVQAHFETYKKPHKGAPTHQHRDWLAKMHKETANLEGDEMAAYVAAMKTFLAEVGEH